jgi:hypothetical protein
MRLTSITSAFLAKHLTYPFLLRRYKVVGPWTRGAVLIHSLYVAVNIFLSLFQSLVAGRHGSLIC